MSPAPCPGRREPMQPSTRLTGRRTPVPGQRRSGSTGARCCRRPRSVAAGRRAAGGSRAPDAAGVFSIRSASPTAVARRRARSARRDTDVGAKPSNLVVQLADVAVQRPVEHHGGDDDAPEHRPEPDPRLEILHGEPPSQGNGRSSDSRITSATGAAGVHPIDRDPAGPAAAPALPWALGRRPSMPWPGGRPGMLRCPPPGGAQDTRPAGRTAASAAGRCCSTRSSSSSTRVT